jgi:chromosome segregation ATPase
MDVRKVKSMTSDAAQIADDLRVLSDRLADEAMATLRRAMNAGPDEQAELRASEKRITRARRALEKAIALLEGSPEAD